MMISPSVRPLPARLEVLVRAAVDRSAAGGRVRVRLEFGQTQAAVCAALDGASAAGGAPNGALEHGLSLARRVFEDYGGSLRWVGRELIGSLDYGS